jgi:hypothetical protein
VIALVLRAPSIHNSQPWRWVIGDNSVHLFADPDRHLPITDPIKRDLLLNCGAALHHLHVAFALSGGPRPCTDYPTRHNRTTWRRWSALPRAATAGDIALATAISRRRTDRRCADVILVPIPDPQHSSQLSAAITDAARHQAANQAYATELAYAVPKLERGR